MRSNLPLLDICVWSRELKNWLKLCRNGEENQVLICNRVFLIKLCFSVFNWQWKFNFSLIWNPQIIKFEPFFMRFQWLVYDNQLILSFLKTSTNYNWKILMTWRASWSGGLYICFGIGRVVVPFPNFYSPFGKSMKRGNKEFRCGKMHTFIWPDEDMVHWNYRWVALLQERWHRVQIKNPTQGF